MTLNVVWLQPASGDPDIGVPGAQFRQVIQALAGGPGVQGVVNPPSAVVTQHGSGADFSVDVQPMQGVVAGDDVAEQGSYLITNTVAANFPTPAAPGSGTRTHRLVAQVRDKRTNSFWTTYDWTPVVLTDTGSGEPAEPPTALTLAHISIAAGQANVSNANITQAYPLFEAMVRYGPWSSRQNAVGAWNNTNTWSDYSNANWPNVTFTVPPSGQVYVTIGGGINITLGSGMLGWRIQGTDTVAHNNVHAFGGGGGAGLFRGSRRYLQTGLTPGGTDTLVMGWFQNQAGNTDLVEGTMLVEAV